MESQTFTLTSIIHNQNAENFQWIEVVKFENQPYLIAADWQTGLFMYQINTSGNNTHTFDLIDFDCQVARDKNITGICVVPDESRFFLLFNNGVNSKIVNFKFFVNGNNLRERYVKKINFYGKANYAELKHWSSKKAELAFFKRNRRILFVYDYVRHYVVAQFSEMNPFRSFEIFDDKFLFVAASTLWTSQYS